jgi:hypothetical protein
VPDTDKVCACGHPKTRIGASVAEKLEYTASLRAIETARLKYACPRCHDGVMEAPVPPQAVEKSLAGEGLLAHDNVIIKLAMPGRVVLDALNAGVSRLSAAPGMFPQVSGLTMTVSQSAPAGKRVREVPVRRGQAREVALQIEGRIMLR